MALRVKPGTPEAATFEVVGNVLKVKDGLTGAELPDINDGQFDVVVQAVDAAGLTADVTVQVIVSNRNVAPYDVRIMQPTDNPRTANVPALRFPADDVLVPEKVSQARVGRVMWSERDAEDTQFTVTVSGADEAKFAVVEEEDMFFLEVADGVNLDYNPVADAAEQQSFAITLTVADQNHDAIALYKKAGFTIESVHTGYGVYLWCHAA